MADRGDHDEGANAGRVEPTRIQDTLVDPPDDPTPPDLGDKFEVLDFVGEGGMGAVYAVRHRKLDHVRCVKVLAASATSVALERLRREAAVATELAHPNIVTVYDLEELPGGELAIVMERLVGADLGRHVQEHGRMRLGDALAAFEGVADALDRMHARGVVHRDLKPANLFLCRDGTIKILDFGISRLLDTDARLTRTGVSMGTPAYMAPEQFDGSEAGPRTDMYALGAVLYHVLTGRRAIEGDSQAEVLANLLLHGPRRADEVLPAVPAHAADALARAMAQDPDERFASAAELMAALRGEVRATPPTPRKTLQQPSRSKASNVRVVLQWLGFSMVALLLIGIVATQMTRLQRPREGPGEVVAAIPERGGTLRVGVASKITGLDPIAFRASGQAMLYHFLFDTLVEVDWTGEPVPMLARTWEVTDRHTRYVFHLREGVVFHPDPCLPGERHEMDSEDVRRTMERMFVGIAGDPDSVWRMLPPVVGIDPYVAGEAETIEGLRVLDDHTLEVRFERPAPYFLHCLAWAEWSVAPGEAFDAYGPDDMGFHAVGTGPFRVERAEAGSTIALVRHEDAWHRDAEGRSLPYLDRIELRSYRGSIPAQTALKEDRVDLLLHVSRDAMAELVDVGERRATMRPGWEAYQVGGYLDEARRSQLQILVDPDAEHPISRSRELRQAVRLGIRRAELTKVGLEPAAGPLADGMLGYRAATETVGEPVAARQYLEDAGYPGGEGLEPLSVCGVQGQADEMQVVARHLGEIGIETVVSTVEFETWKRYLDEGGCDLLHANYVAITVDDDPIQFLLGLCNRARLAERDPEAGALMQAVWEMSDRQDRADAAQVLADALVRDSMIIFLNQRRTGQPHYSSLASPGVRNLVDPRTGLMNPVPARMRQLWIEPPPP